MSHRVDNVVGGCDHSHPYDREMGHWHLIREVCQRVGVGVLGHGSCDHGFNSKNQSSGGGTWAIVGVIMKFSDQLRSKLLSQMRMLVVSDLRPVLSGSS